jgi:hypothetical protein
MIDDIFKIRFIEEVALIANERDKGTKRKLRSFALISYFLCLGSSFGAVEFLFDAFYYPSKFFTFFHFFVIIIMLGFAITFLLTFVIFALAYLKVDKMRQCFSGLRCSVDNEGTSPGREITASVKFKLLKRELKDVKLRLTCKKEKLTRVAEVDSVRISSPYEYERVLAESITAGSGKQSYDAVVKIPEDALKSQPALKLGAERVTWLLAVDFDFLDWHTYNETIPIKVV